MVWGLDVLGTKITAVTYLVTRGFMLVLQVDITPTESNQGVKRLIIESDENDTGGYFVYVCIETEPDEFCYDWWFPTLPEALDFGDYTYGVKEGQWTRVEGGEDKSGKA